jgi:hypothetical protein
MKDTFKPGASGSCWRRASVEALFGLLFCRDTSFTTLPLPLRLYSHFMSIRSTAKAATDTTAAADEDDDNHNDHNYEEEV